MNARVSVANFSASLVTWCLGVEIRLRDAAAVGWLNLARSIK
jgi:hypothetical protein